MSITELVDQLFSNHTIKNSEARAFIDRLLLRFFNVPSLMLYLRNVGITHKDGLDSIQMVFTAVPDDVLPDIERLIATPKVKMTRFKEKSEPCIGFEIPMDPEMFSNKR